MDERIRRTKERLVAEHEDRRKRKQERRKEENQRTRVAREVAQASFEARRVLYANSVDQMCELFAERMLEKGAPRARLYQVRYTIRGLFGLKQKTEQVPGWYLTARSSGLDDTYSTTEGKWYTREWSSTEYAILATGEVVIQRGELYEPTNIDEGLFGKAENLAARLTGIEFDLDLPHDQRQTVERARPLGAHYFDLIQ